MLYKKYSKVLQSVTYSSRLNSSQTPLFILIYPKGQVMYAQHGDSSVPGLNIQVTNLNLIRKVVANSSELNSFKKVSQAQPNKLSLHKLSTPLKGSLNSKTISIPQTRFSERDAENQLTISSNVAPTGLQINVPVPVSKVNGSMKKPSNASLKFFLNKSYTKSLIAIHKQTEKKMLLLAKTGKNLTQKGLTPITTLFINPKSDLKTINTVRPAPLSQKFENSYSKLTEINLITINLASANRIRQWAEKTLPNGKVVGEVINPETIHYKTLKPIKGGLFCERIFGPLKDHECACGKKFNIKNYLAKTVNNSSMQSLAENHVQAKNQLALNLQKRYFCRICDVEYTYSIIRRTQLGYIQLASPTTHVWFVKGIPSYISILLDMKKKHLQGITYNTETLTLENSLRGRQLLPVSPSSIFESWQKIMKTQYPEKYNLSNTDINKATNPLPLRGTQLNLSKPSNLVIRKGAKYQKPKTKKALYKQHLKNYYARKPKNAVNIEMMHLPQASLEQKNKMYLPKSAKCNSLAIKPIPKMQYIVSKKGWFKLIQYVIQTTTGTRLVKSNQAINCPESVDLAQSPILQPYKSLSQGVKTNIFIVLNNNLNFLDSFILLRSPQFLTKYLKNLDSHNPNIGLMSINTILKFSSNNLSGIYKNELLKHLKIQAKNFVTPLYMLIFAKDRVSPPLRLQKMEKGVSQLLLANKLVEDNILNVPATSSFTLLTKIALKFYNFLLKFYNNQSNLFCDKTLSVKINLNGQKSFLPNLVKLLNKSVISNNFSKGTFIYSNGLKVLQTFNQPLWYTQIQNKKQINPLFVLTTSLKLSTCNLMAHPKAVNHSFLSVINGSNIAQNLNKIVLMLVLNLINTKSIKAEKIKSTITKKCLKEIKIWNLLAPNIKLKFILKFFIYFTFTQPLAFIKQFNFLTNKKAFQAIKSIKNYIKLPFYNIKSDLVGELNTASTNLKTKNLFGSLYYSSSLKMLKLFTLYFFFLKKTKKEVIYKLYNSLLTDFKKLKNQYFKYVILSFTLFSYERNTEKGLISVKGWNMNPLRVSKLRNLLTELAGASPPLASNYVEDTPSENTIGLSTTLIKVKMSSKLSFAAITKQNAVPMLAALQIKKLSQTNFITNIWQFRIRREPNFVETFSQRKNLIVNNIYCLSHRELWEQDKDWQDFAYYYYSPGRITDKLIPLYKYRNYDSLFSIDNTLSNKSQTEIYSLGMNINTAFSGAGLIQKLLNDFNFTELKKMDKQNRILLFQYNKHVQKLKKLMGTSSKGINTGNRKNRYQYYKACHIRDVLIRRTKLTRKIFNKLIPNDNFKTVDGQATLKLTSSKGTSSSVEANKNPFFVNRDGVSKLQALQNTTETNGLNMILTLLPVLPPVLRPVLKMSGQFTISDLNRLYQRIIYRNERLKKFLKDPALSSSFEMKYAQRLLQEAVDNLIQNGKSGVVPEKDARGRLLKSLSDILKGKQGRFRQYLLGKRVDYSGRSVIVVGPRLRLHECGIPKEMALVLYSPFLIKRILNEKLADTYLSAKKLIRTNPLLVSQLLREIMKSCPVLLNRAPTLHRLGFQAFQPKLVDGKAILLHPLVCPAFNADFDGDQMAVHVPITFEARAEAWKLMLARNNLLSPATGEPLILPSQDMVLGCYYLTTNCAEKWSKLKKGSGMYFHSIHEVLKAYNQKLIHLHAVIWVNIKGHLETANNTEQPLEIRIPLNKKYVYSQKGSYTTSLGDLNLSLLDNLNHLNLNYLEIYSKTHNLLNINPIKDNSTIHLSQLTTQIIRTTPGKILFNIIVKNAIEKRPRLLSKSSFKGGFIKNKLVNAIDHEIDNYFIRKNTAML